MKDELLALAGRALEAKAPDNALDVDIEIALFKPDWIRRATRANADGSKVIATSALSGKETTYRAWAWTMQPATTAAALRARAQEGE